MSRPDQDDLAIPRAVGPTVPERIPRSDLSAGVTARVVERAVELLDRLRQSEIVPYGTESRTTSTTGGSFTVLRTDDLKNIYNGPWLLSTIRCFGGAELAASAAWPVPGNLSLRIIDNDRSKPLSKTAPLLAVLCELDSNTCALDRPYVFGPASSVFCRVENAGGAGPGVWVSFLGEVVLGGQLSAGDVREAVALGIYPTAAWRAGLWSQSALGPLFESVEPVCATEAGERLRWALRERIAYLRLKLASARIHPRVFFGRAQDIPQAGSLPIESAFMRNDSSFPFVAVKCIFAAFASEAATAAVSVFSNVSVRMTIVGQDDTGSDRYVLWRRTLAPTLVDRSTNTWAFERPLLIRPDASFGIEAVEENTSATTDLYAAVHGFMVDGLSSEEVRECISLGLFSAWRRSGD